MAANKQVVRFGPFKDYNAKAVKVGETLYLSGQVSFDDEGNVVAASDIVGQSRQAYAQIRATLEKCGATMANIVDETLFVTDMGAVTGNFDAIFSVRKEAYGGIPDVTQTLVQVAGLFMPELLIEIRCIAHL